MARGGGPGRGNDSHNAYPCGCRTDGYGRRRLLKIVLVLVIALLALEILEFALGAFLGLLRPVIGLAIVVLVVLFLLDRI
ncbi:hypothetical protein GJ629_15035 [Halapricum sp. CBA1109]|uniref:DUF7554 family protein n=1 Tax=Halapricum sp. CBA1109 TaxID=2668068 RepID=UPI0012F98647|nr:hypothetical protein [Halapricum sp. CBA1109]MUV91039.1 hypothetical protein [Halapricum sp. CBA1109]